MENWNVIIKSNCNCECHPTSKQSSNVDWKRFTNTQNYEQVQRHRCNKNELAAWPADRVTKVISKLVWITAAKSSQSPTEWFAKESPFSLKHKQLGLPTVKGSKTTPCTTWTRIFPCKHRLFLKELESWYLSREVLNGLHWMWYHKLQSMGVLWSQYKNPITSNPKGRKVLKFFWVW